ncbi:MAG TPA: restriction endonuclease subunit S [Nitrososphaeraceae archaeon]|nr:restriction endonuclease subunit S [Nitrososphaeraceae archaeon]
MSNLIYVPLNKILKRRKEEIILSNDEKYRQLTVKLHHRGIVLRKISSGENIKTKKQFLTRPNQFLISRIDARNGAMGLVDKEFERSIVSSDFWTFDIDAEIIQPQYLFYFTQTRRFLTDCENSSTGTTNRKRLQETLFLKQVIPLYEKKEQTKIIVFLDAIFERLEELQKLRKDALENSHLLMKCALQKIFGNNVTMTKQLKDLIIKNEHKNPNTEPNSPFKYVDIGSIDNEKFRISSYKTYMGREAPSRARKVMRTDDVLVGTVRPNLKRISKVPAELDNQICSTGICIIRTNGELTPDFLYFAAQSDLFVHQITKHIRGVSYPAITDKDIYSVIMPVFTKDKQIIYTNYLHQLKERVEELYDLQYQTENEISAIKTTALRKVFECV